MINLKEGMYVRCPMENEKFSREFYIGQVVNVDEEFEKVVVRFFAEENLSMFCSIPSERTFPAKLLIRCNILDGESVIIKTTGKLGKISCDISDSSEDGYKYYGVSSDDGDAVVCEKDIVANVYSGDFNPIYQMLRYEINNPNWYKSRVVVSNSLQNISNAPYGFETLLNARTYLFNHQVDTIIRALSSKKCRYMLADEVGLGKTVESATIIKGLLQKNANLRALFIVPNTLVYQWQNELSGKFWLEVPIFGKENIMNSNMVIIPQEELSKYNKMEELLAEDWDVCLVDETHRLLENTILYNKILYLSKKTENILLLSATPITKLRREYHKLLSLLNPDRYLNMSSEEFDNLLDKQNIIRNLVFDMMNDLDDYIKYNLYDDFKDMLLDVYEMINDSKFKQIIDEIDKTVEDKGLSKVKIALAYLAEFYQIDENIIRHRRKEIKEKEIVRRCNHLSYEMATQDIGSHCYSLYEKVMNYLEYLTKNNCEYGYIENILCATFSGANALFSVLEDRKTKDHQELEYLENIKKLIDLCNLENTTKQYLKHSSRQKALLDYLNNSSQSKVLIFTGYSTTASELEKLLKENFGENTTVSYSKEKSREGCQLSADIFQTDKNCKYMICDESGGEGRNFQIADEIIHYDLPLSPFKVEQRIGRLDRIGRMSGKDVLSTVITSDNTIEKDIFNIFNDGLNVFNESLCGMEIVFESIQKEISSALYKDVYLGLQSILDSLKNLLNVMKDEVNKERHFDLAKQLDNNKMDIINNLINYFSKNGSEKIIDTMLSWAKMVGFLGIHISDKYAEDLVFTIDTDTRRSFNIQCAINALYFPPQMNDVIKLAKVRDLIYGTFSRDTALKYENLTFFAPGNSLYDGIVNNAKRCYKGKCTAIRKKSSERSGQAFKMIFNVKLDSELLIKNNLSLELINLIKQYITIGQVAVYFDINNNCILEDSDYIDEIDNALKATDIKHLGKRKNGELMNFIKNHPFECWKNSVQNAYKKCKIKGKELSQLCVKKSYGLTQLENQFNGMIARNIFYNKKESLDMKTLDVLKEILLSPKIVLDSIAYVEFEKLGD